jgi:hypothetical protein
MTEGLGVKAVALAFGLGLERCSSLYGGRGRREVGGGCSGSAIP